MPFGVNRALGLLEPVCFGVNKARHQSFPLDLLSCKMAPEVHIEANYSGLLFRLSEL